MHGFLNVLKPPGMTSHDVVFQVRRMLPRKVKVGHLGTLDPAATGVLPVAVGQATRLIPLLPERGDQMKAYLAEIAMGISTDTDDLEGETLERRPLDRLAGWGEEQWKGELAQFEGVLAQVPPQVSAIKSDGQRAYARVRKGQTVELTARQVRVSRCCFRGWCQDTGRLRFFLVCSTGTYVRSIARDLGVRLEVGGALAFLVRTLSGPFDLGTAVCLEELRAGGVAKHILAESFPFQDLPSLELEVVEKGRKVRGDFHPGVRYRARNGLLIGTEQAGLARVEAVFGGESP